MQKTKYAFYPSKILKTGVLQKKKTIKKTGRFPRGYVEKKYFFDRSPPPDLRVAGFLHKCFLSKITQK